MTGRRMPGWTGNDVPASRSIPGMRMRPLGIAVVAFGLLASGLFGVSAQAASAPSPGPVLVTKPLVPVINGAKGRKQIVFRSQIAAQAGDRRGVRTDLAVDKVVLPSGDNDLFLGVTLLCMDPSNNTVLDVEAGTNVWTSTSDFDIPVVGTFNAKTTGTYTCETQVMICDPGSCTSPKSYGQVTLLTQSTNKKTYSFLYLTEALPPWAMALQIPKGNDTLVNPGSNLPMTKAFDLSGATGPIAVGSIISLTNCIVANYPPACNKAPKMAVQGSAKVTISLVVNQLPTVSGTKCAVITAPSQKQTITWREHHAVIDILIPRITLSQAAGCGTSISVTTTVTVLKGGNSAVVEGGSKNVMESVTWVAPGSLATPPPAG